MMDSCLIDPNNHAPEVTPDDVRGDAAERQPSQSSAASLLPPKRIHPETSQATPSLSMPLPFRLVYPKRIQPETSQVTPTDTNRTGLLLGWDTLTRNPEPSDRHLEVHEIDGSVVRLAVEKTTLPKVPRKFAFHAKPAENTQSCPHQGEDKEWGRSRTHSLRWLLIASVGVITLIAVAMLLLPLINEANAVRLLPGQDALMLEPEEKLEDLESLNRMLTRQPDAEQIFRSFASATIAADIFPLVRDAETVQPLIRANPRPTIVSKAWLPPADTSWSVFANHGKPCGLLEGTLPDFSKFSAYLVMSNNQLLLDWKATTGYGTATFEALQQNQGDPREIRGKILTAGFFTATFPEDTYQSYQLVAPTDDKAIWCYTRRGDAADETIGKLFADGAILTASKEPQKVTLRLERGPSGALPNQWLIGEMLHKDWIIP
jgi:hypothetical protein